MQEGVLFEASAYIVYIMERSRFVLVCIFRKAIKNFEAKVGVPEGP